MSYDPDLYINKDAIEVQVIAYEKDKKDKLVGRSNSAEIIQEYYQDVMPKSHIGVM